MSLSNYQEHVEEACEITETLGGLGLLEDLICDVLDKLNAQGEDKGSVKGTFITPSLPHFLQSLGQKCPFTARPQNTASQN